MELNGLDKDTIKRLMKPAAEMTNSELKALKMILENLAEEDLIRDGIISPIFASGEHVDNLLTKKGIIEYCKLSLINKIGKSYFKKFENPDTSKSMKEIEEALSQNLEDIDDE